MRSPWMCSMSSGIRIALELTHGSVRAYKGFRMKNLYHYFTLSVLVTLLATMASPSFAGNESGGGGGVLFGGPTPILIDYLNINPNFKDSNTYQKWQASRVIKKSQISIDRKNEDQIRESNAAFDLALTIVKKWEEEVFGIGSLMIHTAFMDPMTWNFVDKKLKAPQSYLPLQNLDIEKIKTAAYYYKKSKNEFDVQISMDIWNQMGILSQSGLLIHEALRHLQIGWANRFDEDSLQHATAILMMCEPDLSLNQYVFYIVQNGRHLGEKFIGKFDDIIHAYCKRTL